MGNIQIKAVPEEIHEELRRRAREKGVTIRDYVLDLLRRDQAKPTVEEWLALLDAIPPVKLDRPAAEIIAEGRAERDRELGLRP